MATVAQIQRMYDEGRIPEALAAAEEEVDKNRRIDDPNISRLRVIGAWCHWRRQEWDDARQWLKEAEEAGGADLKTRRPSSL